VCKNEFQMKKKPPPPLYHLRNRGNDGNSVRLENKGLQGRG
jgi:hypothetical protein